MARGGVLPFRDGMSYGKGVDDLTGDVKTVDAVGYDSTKVEAVDRGMEAKFDTSLVYSAEQMYDALGVSVSAEGRYGLVKAEGKFKFAEESKFNSTSTFLVARADVQNAYEAIVNPRPVADADRLVADGKTDLFRQRYGGLFVRGIKSGGEFIAVLSIMSKEEQTQTKLAASLKASFDGIMASGAVDASLQREISELRKQSTVRVTTFQRGGDGEGIGYVGTIEEVMARLRSFAKSVQQFPKAYSVQVAPYTDLVFSSEPSWFDRKRQQDVLDDCMRKRVQLLQVKNDLEMLSLHPDYFEALPTPDALPGWIDQVTTLLNKLDDHVSKVIDSIREAKYFALALPADMRMPKRVSHSSLQVEVYTHADYASEWNGIPGWSQKLVPGRYDDSKGQLLIGNDQISSLKVPEGLAVRGYEHAWFQGAFIDFTSDVPAVPMNWNDRISSLIVYETKEGPPVIDHVVGLDYLWSPRTCVFKVNRYPNLAETGLGAGALSALLIPKNLVVKLWDQPEFKGASVELMGDTLEMPAGWNDRTASLEVYEYRGEG